MWDRIFSGGGSSDSGRNGSVEGGGWVEFAGREGSSENTPESFMTVEGCVEICCRRLKYV